MYPYLAAELHISHQRHQLARTAERHRLTHPDRSQSWPTRTKPPTRSAWRRRWIQPALIPAP
jgi:hypothetical protein